MLMGRGRRDKGDGGRGARVKGDWTPTPLWIRLPRPVRAAARERPDLWFNLAGCMGWRRWIQMVCLLLSAAPACADGARPHEASAVPVAAAADAEAPAARRFLFWRVSSPGSTVYLLGSIHFGRPEMYPLSSAIDQAYARADALVVEADVTAIDPEQTAAWMAAKAMYRGWANE